jgi:signal transduction histidine kinase
MKKVALLFVLAVLVPSVLLALLAARSLRDQLYVVERQQSLLYQGVADNVAKEAQDFLSEELRSFGLEIERLLVRQSPAEFAFSLDTCLTTNWPLAEVGFAVTTDGRLLCPSSPTRPAARDFVAEQSRFLCNREAAQVYWNAGKQAFNTQIALDTPQQAGGNNDYLANSSVAVAQKVFPSKNPQTRNVLPQQSLEGNQQTPAQQQLDNYSKINAAEAEFRQLIGDASEGILARFVDNQLAVLLWYRSPRATNIIYGAQLSLAHLKQELQVLLNELGPDLRTDVCVALLDDLARPVAATHPDVRANWKRPFVATEIGEALPHWEVAVYLLDPKKLGRTANTLRFTLGLMIAVLVVAVVVGSWLIVNDLKRQMTLARQKTDFVSNVSHELKTPLTSIRMFAELLAEGRVNDQAKQRSYLHIITAEAARLTRLINNVLDFARLEGGEKKYNFQECDLSGVMRETVESYRPHLENQGFTLHCNVRTSPVKIRGDSDALAQVLVNLLSNAEKYCNHDKRIEVRLEQHASPLPYAEVQVLDKGTGVPRGCEAKIFEKFYRAHDSLGSGVQGSGLGLTLARQIARAHGGDVVYQPREGGGSCFALRLPLNGCGPESKKA